MVVALLSYKIELTNIWLSFELTIDQHTELTTDQLLIQIETDQDLTKVETEQNTRLETEVLATAVVSTCLNAPILENHINTQQSNISTWFSLLHF